MWVCAGGSVALPTQLYRESTPPPELQMFNLQVYSIIKIFRTIRNFTSLQLLALISLGCFFLKILKNLPEFCLQNPAWKFLTVYCKLT